MPAHTEQTPSARTRTTTYQVTKRYGLVWGTLGPPDRNVPPFPEATDAAFRMVQCGLYVYKAYGLRAI